MPLNTRIERDHSDLKLRWSGFHVAAMVLAAALDSGQGPFPVCTPEAVFGEAYEPGDQIRLSPGDVFDLVDYSVISATPLNAAAYTLTRDWTFVDSTDGEELTLKAGDTLHAYRSSR